MGARCLTTIVFIALVTDARGQAERFPLPGIGAYAVGFQPLTERPRPFQQRQHYQHQHHVQPRHPLPQQPFTPSQFQPVAYQQWEASPQFSVNTSGAQSFLVPFKPLPLPDVPLVSADGVPTVFQDPQFEQLFQQELRHQIELEQQRVQGQPLQPATRPRVEVEIQKSQQIERPQLQELQGLHQLLQGELQQHEFRQREQQRQQQQQLQQMIQQQQQQQNQVEPHELFMSQRIKPQELQSEQQQQQALQEQLLQNAQVMLLLQQQQPPPRQQLQPRPPVGSQNPDGHQGARPQGSTQLQPLDFNTFLPLAQADKEIRGQEVRVQQQRQQEQRLRQQQRQQETLTREQERRQEDQKHKERLRQQRAQVQELQRLQQQQRQQKQEDENKKRQRQQRQQPLANNGITAPGGAAGAAATTNKTEKQIKSVRDLFNTSSCIEPPLTCPHPRIHFYLYTRTTQQEPDKIDVSDANSLRRTPFNPNHPIKVLIHGFQGGRQFSPSTDLRKAYFTRGDYNIFVVDYNSLVRLPCLSQIQWSPSFLALCVSQLVSYVGNVNGGQVAPDRFHLIGYSIGAHIAGLVANYINDGKLGRITGLDPTIIFYQGSNRSHDLDPSDAHFIDVIHTGAGILGQRGPNGHVDYYVNGGTTQPGCQSDSLIKTLSCDHTKVSPYYVESIVTPVGFWALPCPNLFMYLLGFCQPKDEDYILMGEDAPHTARGIYYLSTNANKPYAKGFPGKRMPTKFPKWRPH